MNGEWKQRFEEELALAEAARAASNEGRARVCARRAAGLAAGEYLQRQGIPHAGPSAYDRLRYLRSLPGLAVQVQEVLDHLLVRITPENKLPVEADLLAEARWLAHTLLEEP